MPRAKPIDPALPNEPQWYLRSIPYGDYRQSRWWRRRRELFVETSKGTIGVMFCAICTNRARWDHPEIEIRFHVHHLSYEKLGAEADNDLMLLCNACHNFLHFPDSAAARSWVFWLLEHEFDIYSRCADVQGERGLLIPLSERAYA